MTRSLRRKVESRAEFGDPLNDEAPVVLEAGLDNESYHGRPVALVQRSEQRSHESIHGRVDETGRIDYCYRATNV